MARGLRSKRKPEKNNSFGLESLLRCTVDDLLLVVFVQVNEVIAVPGHAHQKVAILIRCGLGFLKGVRVHDVELDMVSVEPEVGSDELHQLVQVFFFLQNFRQKTLVQKGTAGFDLVHFSKGLDHSCGAVAVRTVGWGCAVGYG